MLLGEFKHSLDSKNRLRLPAKFKKDFASNLVLTKGTDGCIFIVPMAKFEEVFHKIKDMPMFDSKAQMPLRMLFSSACELEEDAQGRFIIPSNLKEYAQILKDVVFVGVGNRVELWSCERWQQVQNSGSSFESLMQELGKYGI